MVVLLLMWLALSVIATIAFVFGSGLGYRRGFAEAQALPAEGEDGLRVTSRAGTREVRLPEGVNSGM